MFGRLDLDDEDEILAKYQHSSAYDGTVLEGIDDIDWANLQHAMGAATNVPALLRALLSEDAKEQWLAPRVLETWIIHQGTLYEATGYVVPFMVRLLSHIANEARLELLYTLTAINYWSIRWCREHDDQHAPVEEYDRYTRFAYEAVWRGIEQYFALADDPDVGVRHALISLVVTIPNATDQVLAFLLRRITDEPDGAVKAQSINAFVEYLEATGNQTFDPANELVPLLKRFVHSAAQPLNVRFAAATALAHFIPDCFTPQAADALVAGIVYPHGIHTDAPYDLRPHVQALYEIEVVENGVRAFGRLRASQSFLACIQALSLTTHWRHAHALAIAILSLSLLGVLHTLGYGEGPNVLQYESVYPETDDDMLGEPFINLDFGTPPIERTYSIVIEYTDPTILTDVQRAAVRAVVENEQVWAFRSNLLAAYGLPASRDEVRRMLV